MRAILRVIGGALGAAIVIVAGLTLGASFAYSAPPTPTATVTLTYPTTRTDGSAYNVATDQASVVVQMSMTGANGPYSTVATPSGAPATIPVTMLPTFTCGTVYFQASVIDTHGLQSQFSAPAAKTFACPPNPPTITVQ